MPDFIRSFALKDFITLGSILVLVTGAFWKLDGDIRVMESRINNNEKQFERIETQLERIINRLDTKADR